MKQQNWVEYLVCTRPIPSPRIKKWNWTRIYESDAVHFWLCEQDLKETFVQEAQIAFGKALSQVVRLGDKPAVLYNRS